MGIKRYIAFNEEATYNQNPENVEPQVYIDIMNASIDTPTDTELVYQGGLSRSVNKRRPGFYSPSGSFEYGFDMETITYFIKWVLGGYVYTEGEGSLNTHEVYGSDKSILPSFCARIGKDIFEHIVSGCVINSATITIDNEFCKVSAEILAAKDMKGEIKEDVEITLPTAKILAFHEVSLKKDGISMNYKIKTITINISNNLDAEAGRGLASRHPYRILAGGREVSIDMELFYDDTLEIETFWGSPNGPNADGTNEFPLEIHFQGGADGRMTFTFPRMFYTSVSTQPSGSDELVQSVSARALAGVVTLEDFTTINTDIYTKIENGLNRIEGI